MVQSSGNFPFVGFMVTICFSKPVAPYISDVSPDELAVVVTLDTSFTHRYYRADLESFYALLV